MDEKFTDPELVESKLDVSTMEMSTHSQLLGSSSQQAASRILKEAYKQASSLFLTRRLTEALSTLELIILPSLTEEAGEALKPAPIASASRSSRIKVWSLYLTLLNAIIELGPEDGKATFGSKVWRDIESKVRNGVIWEEIVQVGYEGVEGKVDDEVVINLATLLLSQSPNQTINQERLESYLSVSNGPSLDIKDHLETPNGIHGRVQGGKTYANGTASPRDLTSRIKILELYSLHVLTRNGEWTYAKEFIKMSDVLDEERREVFLEALHSLDAEKSKNLEALRTLEVEKSKELEALQRFEAEKSKEIEALRNLEVDKSNDHDDKQQMSVSANIRSTSHLPTRTAKAGKELQPNIRARPKTSSSKPENTGIYKRSVIIINALQNLFSNLAHSLSKNPMLLLRFLLFIVALVVALSRRDVKERVGRIMGSGWDKLRRTVGMGVKVSYI